MDFPERMGYIRKACWDQNPTSDRKAEEEEPAKDLRNRKIGHVTEVKRRECSKEKGKVESFKYC